MAFHGRSGRASVCAPPTHDADKLIHRLRAPFIAAQSNRQRRPGIYNLHPSVGLPVPCPLISRCEEHSAHICCRHAFLPPSFLLSPVRVSCPERTFLKVRASEHGHGFSQPCAAFTPTRAHVMSCLIHDSRLTSAIDLGHTLPPCLKPYLLLSPDLLDQAFSPLLLLVMCMPESMPACIMPSW